MKLIKRRLTKQGVYILDIKTITSDYEEALINSTKNNFPKAQR